MKDKNSGLGGTLLLLCGELAVSAVTAVFFLLIDKFSYRVLTGVALGTLLAIFNFAVLTLSVNRAVDRFMELRGDGEMDDEEAEKFAAAHVGEIQKAQKLSFIIRNFTLLGAAALALISGHFNPIATVIPLLSFQPILIVAELLRRKKGA